MRPAITLALALLGPSSAFVAPPPPTGQMAASPTARFAKKGRPTNVPRPLPTGPNAQDIRLPDDTSMEELLSVMGEKRLKKVARKNRRARNQKIREGKVVLNEKGEWVPRE
ncbi:hypothetical protein ACHAXT_005121 [Thalassiosira profunda]